MRVIPVPGPGAEDVVVAPDGPDAGAAFTGTGDGTIWRVRDDGERIDAVADTGGRPLGIEIDLEGRLLVCDAEKGVLRVDPGTGGIEVVVDRVAGVPMAFCNNAAVAGDGTVWFSDSSAHYGIDRWREDFVQDTATGRLLRLDTDGEVDVVIDGLRFANGVALAADESYVAVAETAARTVVRRWLTGPLAGDRDLLAEDLPGYPDNIARGSDGLIWVSIASPRDALVERLQRCPRLLRSSVTKVPQRLQPQPGRTVRAQAFDDGGRLVHDIDAPADDFHMVTGVREHDGRLWLGSLEEPAIAVVDL
ncbi:MAG TPA: SMP-30/gluconolactonase/LRE family protein [Nocardioides sp.]|uniref:SMP-30/gluconolactonase/LRE family protein n=1 Tax=Nocardioides sp. TaxID=35761 RepID=UPI002F4180FA